MSLRGERKVHSNRAVLMLIFFSLSNITLKTRPNLIWKFSGLAENLVTSWKNSIHIQNVPRQNVPRKNRPEGHVPRDKTFQGQNVPRDKTFQGQNVPRDKKFQGQNVPRDKTSQGTKRSKDKTSQGTKRLKGENDAHYQTCVAYYLIQYGQDKGMTQPNLP